MNSSKVENGKEAAAKYGRNSSIRGTIDRFAVNKLIRIRSIPVFVRTSLAAFDLSQRSDLFAYVIPVAAVSGAVVATYLLGSTIKCTPNLFFCAVVLTSWLGGVGAEIFAVFLSVIALDYYFIPPIYAFGIGLEDAPDMMVFVASATFMTWLNRRGDLTRGPDEAGAC
jgi:K+-sensing histidine kinase KdpD